jgi:hypothetical protein
MRHEDRLYKTMSAVQSCVKECLHTDAPLAALHRYVQRLRRNPQWAETEVAQVEAVARRALEAAKRR